MGRALMQPPRTTAAHRCACGWLTDPAQVRGEIQHAAAMPGVVDDPIRYAETFGTMVICMAYAHRPGVIDAADAMAAGASKCLSQADQRKGRKLTETVDKVLEKRRKGEPADCPLVVASRTS